MKTITWYEVRRQTGERESAVIGRYESEAVAKAVAEAGKGAGWYGANDSYHATSVTLSEAKTVAEAKEERLLNSAEFQEYKRLREKFKKFDAVVDKEAEAAKVVPVPPRPVPPRPAR